LIKLNDISLSSRTLFDATADAMKVDPMVALRYE